MKTNRFLSLVLILALAFSLCVQGVTFTASAENDVNSLLLGDANLDFTVNIKDATNIQKTLAKITTFGTIANATADVDGNKVINIKDATNIQKWSAHLNTPYLIGEFFEYLGEILSKGGFIYLNVNPEIRIGFNADGNVTTLTAENKEAEELIKNYTDYQGKSCEEVVDTLIALIKDAGYLIDDIDGENKVVVIQLDAKSKEPAKDFVTNLKDHAKNTVKDMDVKPEFVKIDGKDYDEKYTTEAEPSEFITLEKAVEIALAYSNVWAEDAVFDEKEYDIDRGTPYYELEFYASGFEFECKVNALNGKVENFEKERAEGNFNPDNTPNETRPAPPDKDELITLDEAKEIALKDAGVAKEDATFKDKNLDLDDGTPYYEIEFLTDKFEYEYEIHAVSGKIIESDCEPAEYDDFFDDDHHKPQETRPQETRPQETRPQETRPQVKPESTNPQTKPAETKPQTNNFIDKEVAKANALSHAGLTAESVKFIKAELDEDDGRYKYDVEFEASGFEYDYEIDAVSGEVLDFEKDRADD
ncbi:MAG: PepSY domain-containing protein [Clostridia bacterium]|nr:PepSY domain-containing protein [Clostridia bacterium]